MPMPILYVVSQWFENWSERQAQDATGIHLVFLTYSAAFINFLCLANNLATIASLVWNILNELERESQIQLNARCLMEIPGDVGSSQTSSRNDDGVRRTCILEGQGQLCWFADAGRELLYELW